MYSSEVLELLSIENINGKNVITDGNREYAVIELLDGACDSF